ncbi:transcription termination/antitermination factor NusG [Blastopirellula marina]|uniref:Transcription termination/antitermination protein NusG n=1 Tax=Blastopirellula marina TaxID=124 RepID=A0A2S8FU15_9BACT|nr:transcription termination/antitermination factor NusG [Blastopirellula marina]RCS53243.1 transcription termination/antitermination factor NusG [Bremerella cremea]
MARLQWPVKVIFVASSPDNSFDPQKDPETGIPADAETPTEEAASSDATSEESSSSDEVSVPAESETAAEDAAEEVSAEAEAEPAPVRPKTGKNRGPIEEIIEDEEEAATDAANKEWYILKVQSNREKSISSNLIRRVKMAGLEDYFGEILVPTEDLVEYKNGKKKVTKQKLYPGYIVVHMAINDETWFLVRETGGIGDFTGAAGKPVPMLPHEVDRIVKKTRKPEEGEQEEVKTNIRFKIGDHVRITEGTFENFEGDVEVIDNTNGRVTVMINIFGRTTPVEMEHWQMEPV